MIIELRGGPRCGEVHDISVPEPGDLDALHRVGDDTRARWSPATDAATDGATYRLLVRHCLAGPVLVANGNGRTVAEFAGWHE